MLKKSEWFVWNEECEKAFDRIKEELLRLPTLLAPVPDRPLILFISHIGSVAAALLAQVDDDGRKRVVYYLSCMMNISKKNYSRVEKACLALIFVAQKLHHYFFVTTHPIRVWARCYKRTRKNKAGWDNKIKFYSFCFNTLSH